MENDELAGIYAADSEIEANEEYRRSRPSDAGRHGRTLSVNERDEDSISIDLVHEETPLLARGHDNAHSDGKGPNASSSPYIESPAPLSAEWEGLRDFQGLPWHKRPSVFWLLPPFVLFTLAFGGIMVPKINLILTLICRDYLSERAANDPTFQFNPVIYGDENPQCRIPEVQSLVSKFTLYCNLLSGILSAIVSPKLGALSDRYGRLHIISLCSLGLLSAEVITIVVASYPDTFSIYFILVGYFFDGLCGSFIAATAITHSYAADCTPPARRNVTFGYFHGALHTGIGMGPILGALVVKKTGNLLSIFYIAVVCHLIFLLFLVFIVPESLSKERQLAARAKHRTKDVGLSEFVDPSIRPWFKAIREFQPFAPLRILYPTGIGSNPSLRRNLILLAAIDTTMFGVAMSTMTTIVIYSEFMFGWGNYESSIFVSIVGACRVFGLLVILPSITRIYRGPTSSRNKPQGNVGSDSVDIWIIRIGILLDTTGYVGYASARTGPLLILSGCIAALGGMGSPTLQSSLTKAVPPDRTGQLLGAIGLLHALARVISPTIFSLIYAETVGKFTQTVFVCLASVFGIAFICSWFLRAGVYLDDPDVAVPRPLSSTAANRPSSTDSESHDLVQPAR